MKKNEVKTTIKNGANFSKLLADANVKGLVGEVVLNVQKGIGVIQAIDMTSSLFLSCEEDLGILEDLTIGINNLPIFIKFFENSEEVNYKIEDEWIILKKHKSQLKCVLSPPASIPTSLEKQLKLGDLKKQCENSIQFTKKMYDELTYYTSIISPTSIFLISEKSKTIFQSNEHDEQQFKIFLGKSENDSVCRVEILTDHFIKVLGLINWDQSVEIFFGNNVPTIVKQGKSFWVLVPLIG